MIRRSGLLPAGFRTWPSAGRERSRIRLPDQRRWRRLCDVGPIRAPRLVQWQRAVANPQRRLPSPRGTIGGMSRGNYSPAVNLVSEFAEGSSHVPLVTIGMPVYNGARYLEEAVRSLLKQTEGDFVLLISDNCSTDATPAICQLLASEDPRIEYHRQSRNLGAVGNFEFLLRTARSPFFMWAAHDDIRSPDCLSESLAILSGNPKAAGCATAVQVVDDAGSPRRVVEPPSRIDSDDVVRRCKSITLDAGWFAVYALFRRELLPAVDCLPDCAGWDQSFVFNVALHRPFAITQRPLLVYREAGWDASIGPDRRMRWSKESGEEGHLYNGLATDMCRYMWEQVDDAHITRTQRMRLRIHIVRLWIHHRRVRGLSGNKLRLEAAMAKHQLARLALLVSARFALAPLPTTKEVGRLLKKWWRRSVTAP